MSDRPHDASGTAASQRSEDDAPTSAEDPEEQAKSGLMDQAAEAAAWIGTGISKMLT